jgi:membrane protease YdiL (CAAX protease family)
MKPPENKTFKAIVKSRFKYLLDVLIIFMGLFFSLIAFYFLTLGDSLFYGLIYFSVRIPIALFIIPLLLYVANFLLEPQKQSVILEEEISASRGYIELFRVTKKNRNYQILYGILFLFLVFIPLDFFTYLFVPNMLDYSAQSLMSSPVNDYLGFDNYFLFLGFVIIIQFAVAFYEESLTRGFLAYRGEYYFQRVSAVIISSLYFGFGHFAYLFTTSGVSYPITYPLIWFIQTFFVGIILAIFLLRKKWIWPLIFSHAVNNIISAHAIWNYLQGNSFLNMLILYIPLLIISIFLFVYYYETIKAAVSSGLKFLRSYFTIKEEEPKRNIVFRIVFDILIAVIIFLVGIIIA